MQKDRKKIKAAALALFLLLSLLLCSGCKQTAKEVETGSADAAETDSGVQLIDYAKRYEYAENMDAVISATSSPHYVLETRLISCSRRRIFAYLAVPKDIDADKQGNFCYINIDDLDNIRVKKDKWVYDNNTRYHYGLTTKSGIKNGAIYYRTCNQNNNEMQNSTVFPFLNDGSYYTYCKRKNNFNWKKLKFDKDCLIEQCLTLTYNSNKYTFNHSLTKTKNKKVTR